ncbi:hypothetical protein [Sutcliffiella rhizosphaerae]|uniref:hypothetical protein n=1 Tax=Sutcliffiella rhizosphaerae TaxID=2880967 RepID=UPI001E58421E|nr:hypothetical protein [Sutcliffiella rhizosphaerae]
MKEVIFSLALGVLLGIISKYLDTIAVDGSWWSISLSYFGDLFTRLGIWILIATFIAAYSKTSINAAINTFLFFIGMLISYYVYSAYLFGFFPTSYFLWWGTLAIVSPFLAILVYKGKQKEKFAYILPALPLGLMLSLSLAIGPFYIDISYIEELIMYVVLCVIFYKQPKQLAVVILLSFIVALIIKQISPYHF